MIASDECLKYNHYPCQRQGSRHGGWWDQFSAEAVYAIHHFQEDEIGGSSVVDNASRLPIGREATVNPPTQSPYTLTQRGS